MVPIRECDSDVLVIVERGRWVVDNEWAPQAINIPEMSRISVHT
jgi:hypothetical protein